MVKYCLICSAARSGSTLLDMLIGAHPMAASLGEYSFLGKTIALGQACGCAVKVRNCAAWTKVFDRVKDERGIDLVQHPYALRQWDTRAAVEIDHAQQTRRYLLAAKLRGVCCDLRFLLAPGSHFRLPLPASLARGVENSRYLYEIVRSEWDKQLVVDSSKNVHKAIALYERDPDATRIVLLIRDGRGVYCSRRSSGFSRRQSITGWYRYYRRALSLLTARVQSQHMVRIEYEQLTADLETTMQGLCDFLGLTFLPQVLELGSGTRHLVNGNNAKFDRRRGVILDQRWKVNLTGEELAYFDRRCGTLNRCLGYR